MYRAGSILAAFAATALTVLFAGAGIAGAAGPVEVAPGPGERAITPVNRSQGGRSARPSLGQAEAPAPSTGVNFLSTKGGLGAGSESSFIPPDTTGAVGPSNILVPLNGRIKVFSRTGAQQYSATLNDFFSSVLPSGNAFDPRVEYDAISGRWFVIAINGGSNNTVMIATSNGSDVATGESAFTFRSFVHSAVIPGDAGEFADYPTLAVDANSLLIGTNNFAASYDSSSLFVINKSDLIAGTVTATGFQNVGTSTTGMFTPQPAENDNPAATESYVIGVDNASFGVLDFRRVTYPGGVPTLSPQVQITVPPTAFSSDDVPAQGSTTPIDALDDRLYEAQIAIDPASGQQRLWTAHNMEVDAAGDASSTGGRIGSRWYELGNLSGTPTVPQAGTVFDSAGANPDSYWIPSIAANGQGHAVFGSSVAGPSRFAGVALAQRFAGESAGTLGPVNFAQPGAGSYTLLDGFGRNRWGDYSQVSIDPTDNMTFWAFQEYVNAVDQWGVRVIEVPAPPPATPSSASAAQSGQASTSVNLTGTSSSGSGFYDPGTGFPKRLSVSVSGGVIVNGFTFDSPTELTLDLDTTGAAPGVKDVTVTNPDGQAATGTGVITVVDATPPETTITSGPSGTTSNASPSFAFTSSESGSTFECELDGGGFSPCSSPKSYAGLPDGPHNFKVRATDPAGNTDPTPASSDFTVDATPPETTITSGPSGTTSNASPSFAFTSSESGSTFECELDGGGFSPCSSPKSYAGLPDGPHNFKVRATDPAGNTDPTPASSDFSVDTTVYKAKISKVKVKGPAKVKRKKKATYKVRITNSGNATATGVRLKVKGRGVSFNTSVGKIGAKKTRTVKVRLKARKAGKVKVSFKVTSKNAGGKTVKKKITVKK